MLPVPARLTGGPWAFFLDVDGTLLAIADAPDLVHVDDRLSGLLESAFRAAGGALALVSGRSLRDLDRLFAPLRLPCAGLHGAERRDAAGRLHRLPPDPALAAAAARLAGWAARHPGTLLEDKGGSLALHYRRAPAAAAAARAQVDSELARLGEGFCLQAGKCVLEIKPRGATKAAAIASFMAEPPFAGRRPVFIGDDVTDEDGFIEVRRRHGLAIAVDGPPDTAAEFRLDDVAAVHDWLAAWLASNPGDNT